MSDDKPEVEPTRDPAPDEAPGGVDAIERDEDDFPPVTPDQPRSAQLEGDQVPDEIEQLDEGQQEGDDSDAESVAEGESSDEQPA